MSCKRYNILQTNILQTLRYLIIVKNVVILYAYCTRIVLTVFTCCLKNTRFNVHFLFKNRATHVFFARWKRAMVRCLLQNERNSEKTNWTPQGKPRLLFFVIIRQQNLSASKARVRGYSTFVSSPISIAFQR